MMLSFCFLLYQPKLVFYRCFTIYMLFTHIFKTIFSFSRIWPINFIEINIDAVAQIHTYFFTRLFTLAYLLAYWLGRPLVYLPFHSPDCLSLYLFFVLIHQCLLIYFLIHKFIYKLIDWLWEAFCKTQYTKCNL